MHRNAAELAVDLLALAGVQACAHVDAEPLNLHHDCGRARQCASRLRKRREVPVAGGVLLAATVPLELLADDPAEARQQLTPTGVTELGGQGSRADDVQEQHRREAAPQVVACHGSIIRRQARGA